METNRTLVIIISYNGRGHTFKCAESVVDNSDDVDVVVWDNASQDKTVEFLRPLGEQHPNLTVHASEDNLLWTPAVNAALEEYYDNQGSILLMNNDIVVRPHVVDVLRDDLKDNPTIGVVGPTGSRLGGPQDWGSHNRGVRHPSDRVSERITSLPLQRTTYIAFAIGMISAAAWKEVGPLDDRLPLSADDHDYCIRLKANGYSVYVDNNAYVQHAGHASGSSPNWNKWGKISWDWFNKKWAGYYANEEEAIRCHWGGVYHPGWDTGTGWLSPREQEPIYKFREELSKEITNE